MTDYTFDDKPKNDNKLKHERERTGQPLTWTQVFQLVLARPSVRSFETILNDPTVSRRRASNWIAIACVISMALTSLFLMVAFSMQDALRSAVIYTVCGAPFMIVFVAIGFYLMVRLLQLATRILGARTPFLDLFYAMAAFNAPLMVINYGVSVAFGTGGGVGLVSFNLVSLFLSLYQLVLTGMSIKATTRFGWGRTVASMVVFAVLVLAIYALLIGLMVILLVSPSIN
ncbi:MAG: hypothetical protein CL607_06160 [Anaerolineaceae bacterium]|nr:hypothetical protein [Anaerolineaceae bacterium]